MEEIELFYVDTRKAWIMNLKFSEFSVNAVSSLLLPVLDDDDKRYCVEDEESRNNEYR